MSVYSSILRRVEQCRDVPQLPHGLCEAFVVCNLSVQQAEFACSVLDAGRMLLAGLGLLYDFLRGVLRAFDVVLEFARLDYPAIDVRCGFLGELADFVLDKQSVLVP
jgi:hypothetical protein